MTTILIVDDNAQNLYMLRFLLEKKGHRVQTASQGKEALQSAQNTPPDIIVTDILMPIMDGFTLCREWQRDETLRKIPFIFYSATYTDEKDIELGLSLGAIRYIIKPQEPERLYGVIEEVLRKQQSGELHLPEIEQDEEPIFLRQYNERLVQKLEEKKLALEEANQRLEEEVALRTADLQRALQEAKTANRLKSQLISDINHELRTPLNNIMLYLALLERGSTEKRPQYLNVLNREAERLQGLITQLLDLSRLEAGKTASNLVPTDINQVVATLINDRHLLVKEHRLQLHHELAEKLPLIPSDQQILFQILTNLLSNAINYTPAEGQISIKTAVNQHNQQAWVTILVQDSGGGITPEEKTKLFERFFRGRIAQQKKIPGTGLGLAISQELAGLLGGFISVQSKLDEGSCFTLWLPNPLSTSHP